MVAMKAMKAGVRAMTSGDLTKKIVDSTQLKRKDVKDVFAALQTIAYAEVKKTEKVVLPLELRRVDDLLREIAAGHRPHARLHRFHRHHRFGGEGRRPGGCALGGLG